MLARVARHGEQKLHRFISPDNLRQLLQSRGTFRERGKRWAFWLGLVALIFALGAPLDQVITFSILSGLLEYTFMPLNIILFRRKWPMGVIVWKRDKA